MRFIAEMSMPRIYDSTSDPHDFCAGCFPSESTAQALFASVGDGPDGRGNCFGYDAEHPPYDSTRYCCEVCHEPLDKMDD